MIAILAILVLSSLQDPAPNRTPLRESVGGLSTFVDFCLVQVGGGGGSTKFKQFNSNKYTLANSFFKPTDKIVSYICYTQNLFL